MNFKRIVAAVVLPTFILVPSLQALSQAPQDMTYSQWSTHLDRLYSELEVARRAASVGLMLDVALSLGGTLLYALAPGIGIALVTIGSVDFLTLTLPFQWGKVRTLQQEIHRWKQVRIQHPWRYSREWDC